MKWTDPHTEVEALLEGENLLSNRKRKILKTHCTNGHELTGENILWVKGKNNKKRRLCRKCRQRSRAMYKANHKHDPRMAVYRYNGKSIESLYKLLNRIESRAVLIRAAIQNKETKARVAPTGRKGW